MSPSANSESAPVAKQIRFSDLVRKCGRPETVTLWTEPQDNPLFMKAVPANRVLTLMLKPHGGHPDFGEIAFHQHANALYLVFPKSLPEEGGARVVGIRYDLIAEQTNHQPVAKALKPEGRPKASRLSVPFPSKTGPQEKPKPVPRREFNVTIFRTASMQEEVTVVASNIHDAEAAALGAVKQRKFRLGNIQDVIKAIAEI